MDCLFFIPRNEPWLEQGALCRPDILQPEQTAQLTYTSCSRWFLEHLNCCQECAPKWFQIASLTKTFDFQDFLYFTTLCSCYQEFNILQAKLLLFHVIEHSTPLQLPWWPYSMGMISFKNCFTCSAWKLSRPVVGSSQKRSCGFPNSSQAILKRFRSPPESPRTFGLPTIVSADLVSPSFWMRSSTIFFASSGADSGPSLSLAAVRRVSLHHDKSFGVFKWKIGSMSAK